MYTTTTIVTKDTLTTVAPHLTKTTENQETHTGALHTSTSEFNDDFTEHQQTSTDVLHTTQGKAYDFTRLTTRSDEATVDHYKETSTANISRHLSTEDIILSHLASETSTEEITERNDNPGIGSASDEMPSENKTTTVSYKTNATAQSNVTSKATSDDFPEENLAVTSKLNMFFVSFCIVLTCFHMPVA